CINTIITSFLYKASPDEVKLVLIDPKVVELGSYNGIPHMLIPVVTDPKKAAAALNWAVNEMQQRYNKFAEIGAKDLASYNHSVSNSGDAEKVMPQIVIVIDELADLMMAASSQVEEAICRLAQKARAAGMHLIVATQRPSVDVVTGLIKANIPSRIAFSVSSQFDSRTIIDTAGAEKLLGKGDMLFSPVEANKPIRIQGPYISETESAAVIDFVKSQSETEYREDVIQSIEVTDKPIAQESAEDELTEDAIEFILKQKQASVSMLQRRFRIGYNRAARIIDEIEDMGIIGPSDGSRPRQVLMTEEEYYGPANQTTFDSGAQNDDLDPKDDEVVNSNGDF
ncbi:MAG: DNA translocase FtsK, partial [Mogibacterium diversum]|nr:DNA translocase FtsK [Mogibacterium diversum]